MAALIFAAPVRPTPAGLLADMLDTLETCVTEPQLRAWVSTTADFRAILPEMLLQRIERARSAREAEVEKQRRRARIADQMAQARVATRHRRADRLVDLLGDNLPAILPEIRRVQRVHGMTDTTFGRRAVGDGNLISDIRDGRLLGIAIELRLRTFIASLDRGVA